MGGRGIWPGTASQSAQDLREALLSQANGSPPGAEGASKGSEAGRAGELQDCGGWHVDTEVPPASWPRGPQSHRGPWVALEPQEDPCPSPGPGLQSPALVCPPNVQTPRDDQGVPQGEASLPPPSTAASLVLFSNFGGSPGRGLIAARHCDLRKGRRPWGAESPAASFPRSNEEVFFLPL